MTDAPQPSSLRRLDRLVLFARGALGWEIFWRGAVPLLAGAATFASVAWLGLLSDRPPWLKILVLVLCGAGGAFAAWRNLRGTLLPSRQDALARIDADSGFSHGEARAAGDSLANGGSDPATVALWRLHQTRLARRLAQARVGAPRPRVARHDRYAIRGGVLVLTLAAAAVAGEEREARLASAFDWGGAAPAAAAQARVDVWVDPPAYTGRPPIVLGGANAAAGSGPVAAPVGSQIVARASDPARLSAVASGGLVAQDAKPETKDAARADAAARFTLRGDGKITVSAGGAASTFALTAIPDNPPTIKLQGEPRANARGSLTLRYALADDYGVIGAEADFEAPEIDGKALTGRTLVAPPRVGLALPGGQGGLGEAMTTADLSDHPWAGARVTMTLRAKDEGGNEGASEPVRVTLPQRRFVKPVARALVEQRRNLVLDPDHRDRVRAALDGLTIAPDLFGTPASVYLGLSVGLLRLQAAKTDADLVEVADYLWAMALQIEDGDLSDAERDLRQAQNKLREALQRGADDKEIRKLTEELRAAMDKFLSEMAEKMRREDGDPQQQADQRAQRNARSITRDDLKAMMDRIEEMARSGDMAEAQRMLEQMQGVLENLRTARRQRRNSSQQEMSRALDELDALSREQQQLRDDTFREGKPRAGKKGKPRRQPPQGAQQPGQQPDDGDDPDEGGDDQADADQQPQDGARDKALQRRQKQLRDKLTELQKRLERMKRGEKTLGPADEAMKEAEDALGDQDDDSDGAGQRPEGSGPPKASGPKGKKGGQGQSRSAAVDAQGRALEALRKGSQELAQQMQKGQGQGQGQGQGDGVGDDDVADGDGDGEAAPGQPRASEGGERDPLGRPTSRDPLYNPRAKYDPMGASPALRAQRVLEELRRRLGDTSRPQEELDYLERLLRRY